MLGTLMIVLIVGAIITIKQKPVYESQAVMIVASNRSVSYASDDTGILNDLAALTRSRSVQSEVALLTSPEVINAASLLLEGDDVIKGFGGTRIPDWAIDIDSKKDSDVIVVSAKAYDPSVAANFANSLVQACMDREQGFNSTAARSGKESVASEMDNVQKQLVVAQKDLADYKRKTKLIVADSQLQNIAADTQNMQSESDKAQVELAAAQRQREALRAQLAMQGNQVESSATVQMSPEYQAALSSLADLNTKRAALIQEYTPESREVKKIDGQIAETNQRLKQIASTVVASRVKARNPFLDSYINSIVNSASAEARTHALGKVVAERNKQIEALPEQERTMTKLMQRVAALDKTYQMLSDRYYTLLLNEKSSLPNARIASTARPIYAPVSPNRKRNALLFLALGLVLSVAVAAVAERMDGRIRDENSVAQAIGETALAIIPDEKALKKSDGKFSAIDRNSPFFEAFRILHNTIFFGRHDDDLKMLAITSPGCGEGKSTTTVYLATAVAKAGKRVLIVDCDLRRPSLHKIMNIQASVGLTNVVSGLISAEEAILSTETDGVFYLPTGPLPRDPAEFLNSMETRTLLRSLSEEYDAVILDCPPCAGLGDVQVISTIAQGVLLVVTMNQTLMPSLNRTLESLSRVGAPVIGFVINRLDSKRSGYDYYYYSDNQPKRKRFRLRKKHS